MLFGKKTALTLSSLVFLSIVSACSSNVVPSSVSLKGDSNFQDSNLVTRLSETVTQSKQDPSHFFIDAGKGQKTGASFSVKLNFANGGAFKTKALPNEDGTANAIYTDMTQLRVALIDSLASPTDLTNAVGIGSGPSSTLQLSKSVASSGGSTTVTFTNVPDSTNQYWIAAAALDSSNNNITNITGSTLTDLTYGKFYVTSGGGGLSHLNGVGEPFELDTVPAGSVKVRKVTTGSVNNYYVSSLSGLTMSLTLKDAIGATIASGITVTNGGDRLSTINAN